MMTMILGIKMIIGNKMLKMMNINMTDNDDDQNDDIDDNNDMMMMLI